MLSGDDSLTLPLMAIGARGVISVVGNIVPRDMIALIEAFDAATWPRRGSGTASCSRSAATCSGLSTNPIPIKAAMKMLGRDTGEMRLPMTPLDAPQKAALRKTLVAYGLLGEGRGPAPAKRTGGSQLAAK